jgi:hypothetical protein
MDVGRFLMSSPRDNRPAAATTANLSVALGSMSVVMSAVCLTAISFPYEKLSFVPRWVFWWSYSPGAFFLWIAVSVGLAVFAGTKGHKLWLLAAGVALFTLLFAMSAST